MASEEISNLKVTVQMDTVGFQDGIDKINRQLRIAKSEFDATSETLGDFGSVTDKLAIKSDALTKQIDIQRQKVDLLQKAVAQSATEKGEDAKQTDLLTIKLNKAQAQLASMQNELNRTTRELENTASSVKQTASEAEKATGMFSRFGSTIKSALSNIFVYGGIAGVIYGITSSLKSAVSAGIDFDSQMQQNEIGFTTLLGSAQEAQDMLQQLADFAQSTPFELTGVEQSAKQMLAMGFTAKEILPDMKAIGDAASALGLQGDGIQRVSLALGQLKTHGVVDAQDMLQLTEAGIPAWDILAQKMGLTVPQLQKMVSQGIVPANQAVQALLDGMEQRFPDMLNKMNSSFSSQMGNLKDGFNRTFGELIKPTFDWLTNTILPALNDKINTFRLTLEQTGSAAQAFKSIIPPDVVDTINGTINSIKTLLGFLWQVRDVLEVLAVGFTAFKIASTVYGAITAIKGLTTAMWALDASMDANPVGLIVAGIAVLSGEVYLLHKAWVDNWGGIQERTEATGQAIVAAFQVVTSSIELDFNSMRAAVLKVLQNILNDVSPVAGLIGKIAPGFKQGFDNIRNAINQSTDDISKDVLNDAAKFDNARATFQAALNGYLNTSASGKNEWAPDALVVGRRIRNQSSGQSGSKGNSGSNNDSYNAGVSTGKSFAQGFIQGLDSSLQPFTDKISMLKSQLQFYQDASDTKDAEKATKSLASAYQSALSKIQDEINQTTAAMKKLNPKTQADDFNQLRDKVGSLTNEFWGLKDALQQLNNGALQQLQAQAQSAADAFQQAAQSELDAFNTAKQAELDTMKTVHQQALSNFDAETNAMLTGIDAQIQALDDLGTAQDRASQQSNWSKQEGDLQHRLDVAQMMGDPATIKSVQQEIADLHDQEKQQRDKWARDDEKADLEKKKQSLQQQRDAQKQAMQQMFQDQETEFQNQMAAQQKQLAALIEGLTQAVKDRKLTQDQANKAWVQAIKDNGDDQVQAQVEGQKKVSDALGKWVQSYIDLGKSYGQSLGQGVVNGLQSMLGAVQSAAAQLRSAASGAVSLTTVSAAGSVAFKLPALASGGIFTGPAIVGEGKDAEAAIPLNTSTMSALASAIVAHMPGGGSGSPQPIYLVLSDGTKLAEWMWDSGLQEARDRQRKG